MMRISTVTMFEQSTSSMNRQQGDFMRVNQQIASGRRVVNPSDDPQAASRAVGVDQSMAITEQYKNSRVSARSTLQQSDSLMSSMSDAVTSAKTLLINASTDTLTDGNRQSIASELRGVYETLIGQANTTDGNGRYLFGGYKDDAPPFVQQDGKVSYIGDENSRLQQVDSSRRMPVADNGVSLFQSVASGAGYIATADKGVGSPNAGSVTFTGPQISDVNAEGYGDDFRITFGEDAGGEATYTVEQRVDGTWETFTNPDGDAQENIPFSPDDAGSQQITFGGMSVTLKGQPEPGDQIQVAKSDTDQAGRGPDLFRTLESALRVLENPAENDSAKAERRNTLNTAMRELDNALDNFGTVQASVGARINELDTIDSVGSNRELNYSQTLSDMVDLDYAEAISEYSLRQIGLQASQKAFIDMKGMSLFNFM